MVGHWPCRLGAWMTYTFANSTEEEQKRQIKVIKILLAALSMLCRPFFDSMAFFFFLRWQHHYRGPLPSWQFPPFVFRVQFGDPHDIFPWDQVYQGNGSRVCHWNSFALFDLPAEYSWKKTPKWLGGWLSSWNEKVPSALAVILGCPKIVCERGAK